ncbi:MAG: UDP-N-acetylglucosamine 2-epimerase (non-hydrolyzing) [Acidobacteriaceae bacterium]|nr:UDP-N-acetylglucosamine 2-epimerase (non-hydrolyzing) [Acidobacteriaceae bacterium]MBV9778837.1 UDP-N-acetylglucosamine 2-epimerase (non-hydrolyzing) [Acidobacteriaceae bacterium]
MTSPKDELRTGTSDPHLSSSHSCERVLVIFGTRPEAIKLCPLIATLRNSGIDTTVCVTAQHRQMLDQVLAAFEVIPDYDLDLMRPGQTLTGLTARVLAGLEPVLLRVKPSLVIVQGDTTTTLCGSLAAFYARVPVAHVEAGLRTFDLNAPFPEEMNRVVAGRLATLHFAATEWAAENLLHEGIAPESIQVTGNTGIDAVLSISEGIEQGRLSGISLPIDEAKKLIVVTAHRRENFGDAFIRICRAISELAVRDDVQIVWPVHLNPNVQQIVRQTISAERNVLLLAPLDYIPFVDLMRRAYLLITDSGGVQEEGPSFGKPILVLRDKTERPEAVHAGTVKLVGTDTERIVAEARRLLDDQVEYERMGRLHNPYGDGQASGRIAERILSYLNARYSAEVLASVH